MSETEYSRLAAKLDTISDKVITIDEKLTTYAEFQAQVTRHDKAIDMMEQRCQAVQKLKEKKSINWGAVFGYVVGALLLALIMKYLPL